MTKALDALVDLLDPERIEVNLFGGVSPNDDRHLLGRLGGVRVQEGLVRPLR